MLFIEGFEQFAFDGDIPAFMRRAGYSITGSFGFGAGRKNGASVMMGRGRVSRPFPSTANKFSVGFAFKMVTRGNLVSLSAGEVKFYVGIDQLTGLITSVSESGYIIPLRERWYYCEVELDKSTKVADVYINGKKDLSVPVPDAIAAANELTVNLRDFTESDFAEISFDDFYVNTGDRIGPITVTTRMPNKDVTSEWGVAGSTSHFGAVGIVPPDLVDRFIFSGIDGATDSFKSSTPLAETTDVRGVSVVTLIRKATVDPITVDVFTNDRVKNEASLPRDWEYRYSELGAIDQHVIPDSTFGVKIKL
ncbi:hypothetical protein JT321_gp15 [Providencia phage Kokobel1]|uniref:Uncharacterized protein n=1 Tax=Providencia phage Kokobel1 TaxID=2783540 RepID=A0A873WG15_9CAUD|nr:hypothetical protein JT321_gp15 [Providencia phage Kokobel1]QPB11442.1 hypothetical protein [Providencia phage Kokobel1]